MEQANLSKRVNVTLPDEVFEILEEWADLQGRPTANLAAYLIEASLREAIDKGDFAPENKRKKK